jgi:hypothetical protein
LPAFILVQNNKIIDRVDGGAAPIILKPMIQGMFDRLNQSTQKNITKNISTPENLTASNHYLQPQTKSSNLNSNPRLNTSATSTAISTVVSNPSPANDISTRNDSNSQHELLKRKFIMSSVKLRVDSADGHSWGSGTIVDTRGNDALILTCGHIFRESGTTDNNGKIIVEVRLYGENSSVKVYGRCIYYDLEIDLALVVIVPPCPVEAIPIAPANLAINAGQNVISVGCDGGADPTIRKHSIMSTNRIGTPTSNKLPFHYIQVSGAPVGGRSGGGLFNDNGFLIGVCNTADPICDDGHFVPAEIIRKILDQQKLSLVYKNPSLKNSKSNNLSAEQINNQINNQINDKHQLAAIPKNLNSLSNDNITSAESSTPQPFASPRPAIAKPLLPVASQAEIYDSQPNSQSMPSKNSNSNLNSNYSLSNSNSKISAAPNTNNLTPIEKATLSEVKRRVQDGDEVILIVRSKRNLETPSDVIVLNNTSEQFIDSLIQQSPTRYAASNEKKSGNQIILSSHGEQHQNLQPHPVTFNVSHDK